MRKTKMNEMNVLVNPLTSIFRRSHTLLQFSLVSRYLHLCLYISIYHWSYSLVFPVGMSVFLTHCTPLCRFHTCWRVHEFQYVSVYPLDLTPFYNFHIFREYEPLWRMSESFTDPTPWCSFHTCYRVRAFMTVELVDLVQSNYSSTIFIQKSKTSSLCQLEQHKLLPRNVKYHIFVQDF